MRILMVASEVPPVRSGVARAVGHLARGATKAAHQVVVRSYEDATSLQTDQLRLSALGFALGRRWIESSFDVIHLHGPAPSVSDVLLLRRGLGSVPVPVVYTHHFTVWGEPRWLAPAYRAYDRVALRLARRADAVVTTTPAYQAHVEAVTGPGTVTVIPWGVEPATPVDVPTPRLGGPLRVLVVGQMRRYKGHAVAVEACRSSDRLELTLAGQGPLYEHLEALAASEPNMAIVHAPSDEALSLLFATHDVILLPATNVLEAFGMVLLEGMRYGCVPVASDIRGVADVAGPSGRVFRANDPSSLRATLLALEADRATLAGLSDDARQAAGEYRWSDTVASYLQLLEAVVGAAGA